MYGFEHRIAETFGEPGSPQKCIDLSTATPDRDQWPREKCIDLSTATPDRDQWPREKCIDLSRPWPNGKQSV